MTSGVRPICEGVRYSQGSAVESVPGKVSGAWVFRGTRMPVATVFENLEAGASVEGIIEWFDLAREQVTAVLDFAARSLEAPAHRWMLILFDHGTPAPGKATAHPDEKNRTEGRAGLTVIP